MEIFSKRIKWRQILTMREALAPSKKARRRGAGGGGLTNIVARGSISLLTGDTNNSSSLVPPLIA